MSRVVLPRTSGGRVDLPSICGKTGVPTSNIVRIRGSAAPGWTTSLIIFSWIGWLIATTATSWSYEVLLPYSAPAFRRWGMFRQLFFGVALLALFALFTAAISNSWGLLPAVAVLGIAAACGLINEYVNACGVRVNGNGDMVLTRVHPAFRDAVAASQHAHGLGATH